jgi:hypothetical protein
MSTSDISAASVLPDYAPIPSEALGPALNEQGYRVGRVARNVYWITDVTYQSAFLTTSDGVLLFDAPPTIGHNIQRAVDEIASATGVSNQVNSVIDSHHHADHVGASSLFDKSVTRIGHEETRRLLLRDDDPARPRNEETFQDPRTLEIGGERIDSADLTRYFEKYAENVWAAFKAGLEEMVATAAAPVIEKYAGVLAAADVFTGSTTFQVLQPLRLDVGHDSWVHP